MLAIHWGIKQHNCFSLMSRHLHLKKDKRKTSIHLCHHLDKAKGWAVIPVEAATATDKNSSQPVQNKCQKTCELPPYIVKIKKTTCVVPLLSG